MSRITARLRKLLNRERNRVSFKFMSLCSSCGASVSKHEKVCPACDASLYPRELTWDEMKDRLIKAGWKEHEADQEIQEMQEETESGM